MSSIGFQEYQAKLKDAQLAFEAFFQQQVDGFEPELKDVVTEVISHPGKRLRPLFVFACAGIVKSPSPQALRMAAIVELIHLATLVHDDILDDAQTRHGAPAHHHVYSTKISVLTGDTLFLRANELAAVEDDAWVGRMVAHCAKATCSGEIAQGLRNTNSAPLPFDEYRRQLLLKTGKLFGLSCALGGFLAGLPEADRLRLAHYGELFGVAYQLYDDAVDICGNEADYKKTLHTDQNQRKWTLPWILLQKAMPADQFEALWTDQAAALKAFETHNIFAKAQVIFEETLQEASKAVAGMPQAAMLELPLNFVRAAWSKLKPVKIAVNQ